MRAFTIMYAITTIILKLSETRALPVPFVISSNSKNLQFSEPQLPKQKVATLLAIRGGAGHRKSSIASRTSTIYRGNDGVLPFFVINAVICQLLAYLMEKLNPHRFLLVANCLVFVTWTMVQRAKLAYSIKILDRLLGRVLGYRRNRVIRDRDIESQMEIIFLSPNKWSGRKGMLTRPFSFFASAFSHNTLSHIISNMLTLHHMRGLIGFLGARRFSQLYLFSIVTSEAVNICWCEFGPSRKWSQGHGASGALSGLLAFSFVCADSKSYYNYAGFKVNKALVSCLALFSDDIAGMLKSQEIFELGWLLKKGVFGGKETFEDSSEEFKKKLGSVGFAVHIGGALGGVLAFWFLYW